MSAPSKIRRGFTLVELLTVIAVISILIGLLLPAVQKAREAANRAKCANHLRQLGLACLNYESAIRRLPRSGEHVFTGTPSGGALGTYKTQDLQSPLTLILPYIEQGQLAGGYDTSRRYNQTPANSAVAAGTPPIFFCPSNPLAGDRTGGNKDSIGYGCADYTAVSYVEIDAAGVPTGGAVIWPAAMTGKQYPQGLYTAFPGGGAVNPAKSIQLDVVANPGQIDALSGGPAIEEIVDGSSNTILLCEAVGVNQNMQLLANGYYDAFEPDNLSKQWRWANPDIASGLSKKLNNNKGAHYLTPDPNGDGCTWRTSDCGPNGEPYSFHGTGVYVVFADGHVSLLRESMPLTILRALATRADGRNEATIGSEYLD
jgi:prepilin-type N-terminal cleavage/methylation domain-containing protein/prepilin-type processing-associated H-X9-DG protein